MKNTKTGALVDRPINFLTLLLLVFRFISPCLAPRGRTLFKKACSRLDDKKFPTFFWNLKFYYLAHKSPRMEHCIITLSFLKKCWYFNIVLQSLPNGLVLRFSNCGSRTTSGPRVCPCGPFRLNISPKKAEKIKLT